MKLILNDGTIFENSHAIENGNNLYVYIQDGTSGIRDVFDAFIDPAKTSRIEFVGYDGNTIVFRGYNRLIAVRDEGREQITAVLCVSQ